MSHVLAVAIERLASHSALKGVPTHELEWLASHGTMQSMPRGAYLARTGDPRDQLFFGVLFVGSIVAYAYRDGIQRKVIAMHAGDLDRRRHRWRSF